MGHYCENHILAAIQRTMPNAKDDTVTIKAENGTCLHPGGCVFHKEKGYSITFEQGPPPKPDTSATTDTEVTGQEHPEDSAATAETPKEEAEIPA